MDFPVARIPFQEAIESPALLKGYFKTLSDPQKVALKAYYGLPLTGWELDQWAVFQGSCTYDELGYVRSVTRIPYTPKEYEQACVVFGRRSGKTDKFMAPIIAYEAAMGGHMQHADKDQDVICYLVAQKLEIAQSHLSFVRNVFRSSPLLARMIVNDVATGLTLSNGISIRPASPSVKAQRGMAIPVVAMDEVGFWYTDPEAANPDEEVERALSWAQAQFPFRKRFLTSTPWAKEGLLWKYHEAGTLGTKLPPDEDKTEFQELIVLHSTTAAIQNPRIESAGGRKFLARELAKDPEAYEREALARFVDAISGFLSPSLLREAVELGVAERPPLPRPGTNDPTPTYIAAIDPAFRGDSFAFTVVHHDIEKGIVQDYIEEFKPLPGRKLDPVVVLDSILPTLTRYRVKVVYTDQYQFEALYQLALQRGVILENVDFTARSKAKIMGSLQTLVNTKRLRLLDGARNHHAAEQYQQLVSLEKTLTAQGQVSVAAPRGRHDDLAIVLALAAFKAVWQLASEAELPEKPKTIHELCMDTIRAKRRLAEGDEDDW